MTKPKPKQSSRSGDPEVEAILDDFAREDFERHQQTPDPGDVDDTDDSWLDLFSDVHDGT